jgi:putative membrane protein insertion efficiency factor
MAEETRIWPTIRGLPARGVIAMVRLYQVTLSPWVGYCCRYQPSCSNYMIEAVQKYGFWKGTWLGIWRICRCHPLAAGGYDPP